MCNATIKNRLEKRLDYIKSMINSMSCFRDDIEFKEDLELLKEIIKSLSDIEYNNIINKVAINNDIHKKFLYKFLKENEFKRMLIASNESTPEDILEKLSNDDHIGVRIRVGRNEKTPEKVLKILAKDTNLIVRLNVSVNEKSSVDILKHLAADKDEVVRRTAKENKNVDSDVLDIYKNTVQMEKYLK